MSDKKKLTQKQRLAAAAFMALTVGLPLVAAAVLLVGKRLLHFIYH